MRDGLFYIADGNGQKVARYDSYGDVLFVIYNDATNPPPLSLRPPENEIVTRWAYTYPFREPGKLAVDTWKRIYVADQLAEEQVAGQGVDPETGAPLDYVALCFDENGRFTRQLGQEGVGGRPFPEIEKLYTSLNEAGEDELVVVSYVPGGKNVYWFTPAGMSRAVIKLREAAMPIPAERNIAFASLDAVAVAPDERKLYVKVNYYHDTYDASTNTRTGNEPDSSIIWIMRVETGVYEPESLEVTFYETTIREENGRKTNLRMFYSMLGVINEGKVFLSFPVDTGYSLLMLSADEQRKGSIRVASDELEYNTFHLSDTGILSAMLVSDWDARLVWWRTDGFIERKQP
jgi:hypothetical protein